MTKNNTLESLYEEFELSKEEIDAFRKIIKFVDIQQKGESLESYKSLKNILDEVIRNDNK